MGHFVCVGISWAKPQGDPTHTFWALKRPQSVACPLEMGTHTTQQHWVSWRAHETRRAGDTRYRWEGTRETPRLVLRGLFFSWEPREPCNVGSETADSELPSFCGKHAFRSSLQVEEPTVATRVCTAGAEWTPGGCGTVPLLGVPPKEMKWGPPRDTCTPRHLAPVSLQPGRANHPHVHDCVSGQRKWGPSILGTMNLREQDGNPAAGDAVQELRGRHAEGSKADTERETL